MKTIYEYLPGGYVTSSYIYHGHVSGLDYFRNEDGKLEAFGRRNTPLSSWHLFYNDKYYEFVSSLANG